MMNLVFVIQKTEGKQTVSDFLLLEEALLMWRLMGYKHPEYQIMMCKGPVIPIPESPIEAKYIFVSDQELQEVSNNTNEILDDFTVSTFLLGGYHESGS